jgi:hypothetical protein
VRSAQGFLDEIAQFEREQGDITSPGCEAHVAARDPRPCTILVCMNLNVPDDQTRVGIVPEPFP